MKIKFIISLLLIFIFVSVGNSQTILKKVQKKFNSTNDFTSDFVQKTNGDLNFSGKIKFKQKDKIRIEFENILIVSDGRTNWNYNKKTNKIIISTVDETPSIFSINQLINDLPNKGIVTERKEENNNIIKIDFNDSAGVNFNYAELYFNNSYKIKKILLEGVSFGILEIVFTKYIENVGLKNSIFKILPSEGTEIIDLR
ncbi:MAG: hypothetical protein CO128_09855 [Ignavibacteriales bacterium CG_4_9_14_3_um_filter_30_11]|nr:MAG: hypothetical protein CO128_09855 [Ignavibacteriales bacterium CG_4_9_14_3_um_filter_30_11]